MINKKGFNLVELIIVIIIIGILVAIAIPSFLYTQERAFDKDAVASLKLIQAAEKIYHMEMGNYFPVSGSETDHAKINEILRLSLPTTSLKWNFSVDSTASGTAQRTDGATRNWSLPVSNDDPACVGASCP